MDHIMSGMPVAEAILAEAAAGAEKLKAQGITPKLAVLRVGESPEDLRYERSLLKKGGGIGLEVDVNVLPADCSADDIRAALWRLDEDQRVHGILMFRPLPAGIDEEAICREINPEKDVDGATEGSLAGVFTQKQHGFSPCVARAVMEMLDYHGVDLDGKKVTLLGRSLVVGKPLAMMLLAKNATLTIAHDRTKDLAEEARRADILISCMGQARLVKKNFVHKDQLVIDAGVSLDPASGELSGDIDLDEVEPIAASLTPMRGGVGVVTTAVLLAQVVEAAFRRNRKPSWSD